jgi:hypothetical protein
VIGIGKVLTGGVLRQARWLAVGVVACASVGVMSGSASAITGCPGGESNGHCYAIGVMGDNNTGTPIWLNAIGTDLYVTCLSVADRNTDFANYEMWMSTNDNDSPYYAYWVEEGMKTGIGVAGQNEGFTWFWADNRPNGGGYNEHYLSGASVNTWTNVSFYWLGGSNWDVEQAGHVVGESTNNGAFAGGGDTGAEVTTQDATVVGQSRNWQYADPSWDWHPSPTAWLTESNNWLNISGENESPGSFTYVWNNGSCGNARSSSARSFAASPLTPASAPAALRAIALRAARVNGDDNPASIEYVATTRHRAQALLGQKMPENNASYFIQVRGNFTGHYASVPRGAKLPTGNVMTLTVSAATGQVTDASLSNSPVNLASLGHTDVLR